MIGSNLDPKNPEEAKLPLRDWIILPLISLMTIGLLTGGTQRITRRIYPEITGSWNACMVTNDPVTGVRGIPNAVCRVKIPENQMVEYRMNSCGHRAGMECGPKPPDVYRIVMAGSSFAMGMEVQRELTFAALLPQELSRQTGQKIEIYNEGMHTGFPHRLAMRFDEVLSAKPDMILWVLTPWDVQHVSTLIPDSAKPIKHEGARRRMKQALAQRPVWKVVPGLIEGARELSDNMLYLLFDDQTKLMLQHFLYENQSQYMKSFLMGGDDETGFLKSEPSPKWQNSLHQTDIEAATIEAQARVAGIPFVAVLVPNRAQAAMISMGEWPEGYDPYKLDEELRTIIVKHGGTYVDILPDFRTIPNPERGYYPVDGHPNADGHAIISGLLAKALTSGAVAQLKASSNNQQAALEQGR